MRYDRNEYRMDWRMSPSDYARHNAAIRAYDKRMESLAAKERLARLAVCALAVFVAVAMFYGATGAG